MLVLALLKWVLVAGALLTGAIFLLRGLGADLPFLKYEGLEAYEVPVGALFLVVAVLLARFWQVSEARKIETERSSTSKRSDGTQERSETTKRTETIDKKFERPF